MVNILKQIELQRKRVTRDLLPDTCTITPVSGENVTISSGGIVSYDTPQPRTWVNPFEAGATPVTAIPCRLDSNRSQQPDKLKAQIVTVNQYYLQLPYNVTIIPTDIVKVGSHQFRVTKLETQGELKLTVVAILTELNVDLSDA